jgi:hypothetical protein
MQTSGLILDVYDDVGGAQLKSFFPTAQDIPGLVKSAHVLDSNGLGRLPDDVFALVLVNGEEKLRKYACIDEGNTALSVVYFLKNAHKLPAEARQRTAENLKVASGWYGLDVPEELQKEAIGVMTALNVAQTVPGAYHQTKSNLAKVRAGEREGGAEGALHAASKLASSNASLLKIAMGLKVADVTGTHLMQLSKDDKVMGSSSPTQTIKKTSSTGRLVTGHRGESGIDPEVGAPVSGESPKAAPQHMNPVVEVTNKEPKKQEVEKKASRFALPSYEKYPLDNYGQVKQAAAYFEEYGRRFSPVDRHEFCLNLTKRASELLIPVSDTVRKYGSEKYASAAEFEAAIDSRRQLLSDPSDVNLLDKVASIAPTIAPESFAPVLGAFDESVGLHHYYDSHVMDPYYSTFGFQKVAEESDEWSDVVGNYQITAKELKTFALAQWMRLQKQFGLEFAEEFRKDPIAIYKSLPVDQKKLIIRLATENAPV